jgi:SsrA-binding protein
MKRIEILNRRAYYDYAIVEHFDAGMILVGSEVKSIREGNADLSEAFIYINNGEAFIKNMYIAKFEQSSYLNHEERQDRKLLLTKTELAKIEKYLQVKGTVIIAIKIFFSKNWAKLKIGIGRGKKTYDKRQTIKDRDIKRDVAKDLANK